MPLVSLTSQREDTRGMIPANGLIKSREKPTYLAR